MKTSLAAATSSDVPQRTPLRFGAGLPGLEEYRDFVLIGIDDTPVYWLQCNQEPEIALPVASAAAVAPNYAFELSTADAGALELERAEDALVLVVLSVPRDAGAITANLFAPIVVNRTTRQARQVILEGSRYSLRHTVESLNK